MVKLLRLSVLWCLLCTTASAQINLTNGLVAYYPFNGTFNDASGSGNNGTAMNGVTFGTDQWGNLNNAASFDGIDDWINVPASASLTPGGQFAIAFRFKTGSSAMQTLISKSEFAGVSTTHSIQYQIGINASSVLSSNGLFFGTNHYNSCVTTNFFLSNYSYGTNTANNQWYCVVVTFNNGVKKVYMNGALISTVTVSGTANNTSVDSCVNGAFKMGAWWQGGPLYFNGLMDEVRVWNRAINTQEIDSLCHLVTPPPAQTVINKYAAVTGYAASCNAFTVDTATGFAVGDTVLMIQMKGATIDTSNTSAFGSVLNYNGAGNYEYNVVSAVSGNTITLRYKVAKSYNIPNGRVQFVRVPYFTNYTVNQLHTCMPWNGSKGGIVVLNASGTITLNAPIDASYRGFRHGALQYVSSNSPCNQTDYYYASGTNPLGAEKGEGIVELSNSKRHGRGAQANGGGGGNSHNTGGGGGGNAGAGGTGGKETAITTCAPAQAVGGLGGLGLSYSNTLNKVFMGGGSGAGHANDGHGGNGTPGGGIVLVMANQVVGNGRAILANGGDGIGFVGDCWDGQPGGSAGGSVLMHVNSYSGNTLVSAKGGIGASKAANNTVYGATGPGGGGGGGVLWVKGASIPGQITSTLSGGANGVFLNNNDAWGATPGQPGTSLSGLTIGFPAVTDTVVLPVVNLGNDTLLCPGDTITLNAGNPGSTYLYSTGAITQTTKVTTGNTYSVAVGYIPNCVRRDTIVISNGVNPVVQLGNDTTICPGATITLNGGSFGSGYAYLYSNSATTQTTNVTTSGTYSLRVTNLTTGCRGRDTIVVFQGMNPLVNLGNDTVICPAKTITLDAGNIGSTYLYNTGATTRTTNVTTAGTYSVFVTDVNKCVGGDTIVIAPGTNPVVNLGPDTTICYGNALRLNAGNTGSVFLWSTGANTQTWSVLAGGTYWVRVTNAQGCAGFDTTNIVVLLPATVSTMTRVHTGPSVAFSSNASNATAYYWSFGDGATSTAATPTHTYSANGVYNVRLIVASDCGSDTVMAEVHVSGVGVGSIGLEESDISVYPNPASRTLTLENAGRCQIKSATVFNGLGAIVLLKEGLSSQKEKLDVSVLAVGIYMLRIETDAGVFVRRVQVLR